MTDHTCASHHPGAPACYRMCACRCDPCLASGRAYGKRQRVGATARIPQEALIRHLTLLAQSGMTDPAIAAAAGIDQTTVMRLRKGQARSARRTTARAIMAVKPQPCRTGFINASGTIIRLRALAALGWTSGQIAERLGVDARWIRKRMYADRHSHVIAASAADVNHAYSQMAMTTPTGWMADRQRRMAAAKGWAVPLAWDEGRGPHGIDNPDATPAVTVTGPDSNQHRADELARLLNAGESAELAVLQCGWASHEAAVRWLNRNGHTDLCRRIHLDADTLRRCAA